MTAKGAGAEINGDLRLPATDRVRYLVANLRRNLAGGTTSLAMRASSSESTLSKVSFMNSFAVSVSTTWPIGFAQTLGSAPVRVRGSHIHRVQSQYWCCLSVGPPDHVGGGVSGVALQAVANHAIDDQLRTVGRL